MLQTAEFMKCEYILKFNNLYNISGKVLLFLGFIELPVELITIHL